MKKKPWKAAVLLILAVAAVAVICFQTLPRNLGAVYPEFAGGSFSGYLKQGEQSSPLPENTENEQIAQLLQETDVKPGAKTNEEPETAFCLRFSGETSLSIVVGQDGSISLAETENLEATRRFWKDDGSLFEALYAYYLQSGGDPLPGA